MSCSGITVIIDHKGDFEDLDVRFWFTTNVKKYKPIGDLTPITISNKSGFKKLIEVVQGIGSVIKDLKEQYPSYQLFLALEGYAFAKAKGAGGANSSSVFQAGETGGCIKYMSVIDHGAKVRVYAPKSIKKWATGIGSGDKLPMYRSFALKEDYKYVREALGDMPSTPLADVIDSYFIAELLLNELKLRYGKTVMSDYTLKQIEVFNSIDKEGDNILVSEFLEI